jgi:hypothetical protein
MKQKKHPFILQAIVVIVGNLIKKKNVFQCFFLPPSPQETGNFLATYFTHVVGNLAMFL